MAGTTKKRLDVARLQTEEGLVDLVVSMAESGSPIARICEATGLSKQALYAWQDSSPEHAELFARARARAAHDLVDETLTIADEADPEETQKAKLRIQARQWAAERWNRKDYGQAKAEVAISISGLHIEALKRRHAGDAQDIMDVEPKPVVELAAPTQEELDSL
jgi:hypothetical protein